MKLKRVNTTKLKKVNAPVKEQPKYHNLKEIVDRKRPFSMMYSGVEDENNFNILYNMGIRNFLISFHYVQKKHLSTKKYRDMGVKFFVDSGAFTFMSSIEHQDYTIEEWESYIQKYLNWIERNKDIVFAFANLDIEYIVGGDKVQEWNEKYFEPFMLRTGIPVCFVYHDNGTILSWEQYCQRYPYVGISWGGIDNQGTELNFGLDRLRIAEKYNSVVHGMAMTQTALLTKLPFYTVDSTTWLVGLQYGEINYWTGKKMSRLKKDKWKGSMLSQLVANGFDEEKLLDEDTEEMIRVNVYAFIEAEKYVQDKLKSRMYWLKPEKTNRTENDLDSIQYPSPEWLSSTDYIGWEEYAKSFNITTAEEYKEVALDCIFFITCVMNWDNPEYKELIEMSFKDGGLKKVHDTWINRIVSSDEERLEDLKHFFTEVLLGREDKLLLLGTNFDRIVKERDEKDYITEDDEYDMQDVSEMEVINKLSGVLPPSDSAPEISELDDEIFRDIGIVPVRDAQGKFLKGQRAVAKPKKLYSKKYPKLACDTCFNAQKCPQYKAGYACAYNKMFERFNTRDMGDIIQAMQGIVDFSLVRLQRGMMTETLEGGIPDPAVTNMMNQTMGYLSQLQRMYEYGGQEVLRQTKIMRSDGTQEITTQVSNPQQGGILEKIFGDMKPQTEEKKEDSVVEEPK